MSSKGRGRKTEVGRGLPQAGGNRTAGLEPPSGLEGLACVLWCAVVEANPDIPAARSVSLALLCSQLAELSRLRSSSNSIEDMNLVSDRLKLLTERFAGVEMEKEERLNVAEQRLLLVAIRDSAIKRQQAEQNLVLSITRLEEELGLDSVKIEEESKVNLAAIIEQGSYRSG